jgi:hypothetical protein
MDPGTANSLTNLYAAKQQLDNIDQKFNKDYLGPLKGTDTAFAARRRVGTAIGAPLGDNETSFRQSLADVKDQLLRARSGAQINEQEYQRLANMLPAATDEEKVFKAGMGRFRDQLQQIIGDKEALAKPRSRMSGAPSAGNEAAQAVTRSTSKSGKPILSRDGGKTWEYAQ